MHLTLYLDETYGNNVVTYSSSDMQKHRSIALLLQVQVLTYVGFRLYVRPSVQQRSSGLCVTVTRCQVKSSLTKLIERGEKRQETRYTHR